jgi:hypothetical protein
MNTLSAALWCAAAALPALAHATTTFPDPTAGVPVPPITVPSAFDGYHRYQDGDTPSWQELNQAATTGSGMAGMTMPGIREGHGSMPMTMPMPNNGGGMQ